MSTLCFVKDRGKSQARGFGVILGDAARDDDLLLGYLADVVVRSLPYVLSSLHAETF